MSKLSKILAIDTALEACTVSVRNNDNIHTIYEPMGRGQTERLLPMIVDACEKAGTTLRDIEAVCVTAGPGSFTGVRVGLSVARTLESTQNIPLYGMTTFEAVSLLIKEDSYGVALKSKRDDVYFQLVKDGKEVKSCVSTIEDIKQEYPDLPLFGNVDGVEAVDLGNITEKMIVKALSGEVKSGKNQPVYLRDADISKSKKIYRTLSDGAL